MPPRCVPGVVLVSERCCLRFGLPGRARHVCSSVNATCVSLPYCLGVAFNFAATPHFHRASSSICWSQPPACCWCGRARAAPTAQQRSRQPSAACVLCCLIPRSALPTLEQSAPSWQVCMRQQGCAACQNAGPLRQQGCCACQLSLLSHAWACPSAGGEPSAAQERGMHDSLQRMLSRGAGALKVGGQV